MIKKIIYFLVLIIIIFGAYKLLSKKPSDVAYSNPDLVFYWGEGCPHCQKVEDYIKANNINQKLKITSKEVYQNQDNQKDLANTVSQYCPDLNQDGIGVPLAFDPSSKKCIQGDQPIIDFLSQKAR